MRQKWKYIFLFLLNLQLVYSATIYVKYDAAGANNGSSWINAYTSFQSALNVATTGDQIWVALGTYKPSYDYLLGGGSRYYHFRMVEGVAIYGGFAGTETNTSQRVNFGDGQANETILSGDLNSNGNDNNDCYHIFYHPNGVNLTNTALLNGFTLKCAYSDGAYPHDLGGAMFNYGSSPSLIKIIMKENRSNNSGSCMYNGYSSSPIINQCKFYNNYTVIYNEWFSSPTIVNSEIYNNYSNANGLALSCYQHCQIVVINTIIHNNPQNGFGAVFLNANSNGTFTNVTFTQNNGQNGTGVMWVNLSSPTLNNCIIYGNLGNQSRNFYVNSNETITLNNCLFDNAAGSIHYQGSGTVTQNNCISSNPQFIDAANDDYRISSTSPCLDAGNSSYNSEAYDIRGDYPRKLYKYSDAVGTIDIGAYEFRAGYDALITVATAVSNIGITSVVTGGTVYSDGVPSVTARGIVWSTSPNPTVALSTKTSNGTGGGSYSATLTNLEGGTTYYLRAYATNSAGTAYSEEISFRTLYPILIDGNQDGVLDSTQDHVHTFYDPTGTKLITIVDLNNNVLSQMSSSISNENGYTYPYGLINFKVTAAQTQVKIILHGSSNLSNYDYRKLFSDNRIRKYDYAVFGSEVIARNTVATVTLTLVDGGIGDSDGIVNGVITDPGGPAIEVVISNIPTLSEWARIFIISLLVVFGVWKIRKLNV